MTSKKHLCYAIKSEGHPTVERRYELAPRYGEESFYGEATVEELNTGDKILYSSGVPVVFLAKCGVWFKLCDKVGETTLKYIRSFLHIQVTKSQFERLEPCVMEINRAAKYEGWGIFTK